MTKDCLYPIFPTHKEMFNDGHIEIKDFSWKYEICTWDPATGTGMVEKQKTASPLE